MPVALSPRSRLPLCRKAALPFPDFRLTSTTERWPANSDRRAAEGSRIEELIS